MKQKRLCFVCLEKGNSAGTCKLKYVCNKCNGKHNIAICTFSKDKANIPKNENAQNNAQDLTTTTTNVSNNKNNVLLQTATVSISGVDNKKQFDNVQLLFDSGSQRSYISEELCISLNLPTLRKETIAINTLGSKEAQVKIIDVVPVRFVSQDKVIETECFCTSLICAGLLNQNILLVSSSYPHLKNLSLADTSKDKNKEIDILIGADYYYRFIYGKQNEPIALESVFGWILTGYYKCLSSSSNFISPHLLRFNTEVCDVINGSNQNIIKDIFEDKYNTKSKVQSDYLENFKGTYKRYMSAI